MPDFNEYRIASDDFEYRQAEDDNYLGTIAGVAIRYGDRANLGFMTEEVVAGAFGPLAGQDLYVNRMHERSQPIVRTPDAALTVMDNEDAIRYELKLAKSSMWAQLADDEIKRGLIRGTSIEMRVGKDELDTEPAVPHRRVLEGRLFGWGLVDRPAYPRSTVQQRELQEYLEVRMAETASGLAVPEYRLSDVPEWARGNCQLDHRGRMIFIGGDLDCRYEDFDVEDRQMPRLRGRLPYSVDGITSMARNEHVRFLPGAFADSLDGEILALVGGDYDNPLGGTAQRSLSLADADDALTFSTSRIPETTVNRDFIAKLRGGYVQGVTAGWALQGSDTIVTPIDGGGRLITVRKARLCELRFRTRSAFAGESIQASPRRREAIRFQVA